jgi:hypothetical protein
MWRELQELSKEELIEVVQDYQEMVSELEELAYQHNTIADYKTGDAIRDILYKERPGWKIHDKEKENYEPA